MDTSTLRLIAIDFYDGPIEGFVRDVEGNLVYFFKVVAWDEHQNRRLYLLGQVDKLALERLLATLPAHERSTSGKVLVPSWTFDDANAQAIANSIVEEGRHVLATSSILALGENLLDAFEVLAPTEVQIESARDLAKVRWPGSLSDWMAGQTKK